MIGLYAIVHQPTNRCYVGSANDVRRRFKEHRSLLRRGSHHSRYLQNAWNKYGEQQFVFKVVAAVDSLEEARTLEQIMLDCFYGEVLNCRNTATGFAKGDAHHAKRSDFHMKTVLQRLTPEERKAKYGKTKGTKRDGAPYVAAAAKRLADQGYRARLSEACKGKRAVVKCSHCGLEGGGGNMRRYHFDKCKAKP
jgi:group I intron endonuclease